ncbi:MAG: 2-ketocyclohexanecarboxyl-CoA hydrolase [Nocardioidaceae bacterium]|nr:2-ketocyclohexanecarboxyl-CoA hydrolase [Nocardioidaceae bacterium]
MRLPELEDVLLAFDTESKALVVTINRPERYNAFRGQTVDELVEAFRFAWAEDGVRSVILTGAGDKAFCTGGDVKQRAETGDYGPTRSGFIDIDYLHRVIREVPKPVIAAVNGFAIGGGQVLHILCDLSIASENAVFGQVGPRVGSFDAGWGTVFLARLVGERKAREIWYLCRRYSSQEALDMGLVNKVVPPDRLMDEARSWAAEIAVLSPTAIKFCKFSFNADTEHHSGIEKMSGAGLELYLETSEAGEYFRAFTERRPPRFSPTETSE